MISELTQQFLSYHGIIVDGWTGRRFPRALAFQGLFNCNDKLFIVPGFHHKIGALFQRNARPSISA